MKITERGQVTIPQALRERYGFLPDTEVEFVERDGELVLVKGSSARKARIRSMYGKVRTDMTTDEIMTFLRD